jgi:hypothetical protein
METMALAQETLEVCLKQLKLNKQREETFEETKHEMRY